MYILAWRDIAVRYKQTTIGVVWALIQPAMTMLVFVGFRRLVGFPTSGVPEPILVFSAVLPWQFFSTALSNSANSLISNSTLISKVYFPRLLIPCGAVVTGIVDFLITLGLLAILMLWYGYIPSWQFAVLPFFMLLAFGLSVGIGLLLAALNVEYRDFRYIVPFILQLGLFVSPIAFSSADVPERWRTLYAFNPMVGIIDGFRWSILRGQTPLDPNTISISVVVTTIFVFIGVFYFRHMERGFADVI
jgi:lipopolysaccharide transport system permease protein